MSNWRDLIIKVLSSRITETKETLKEKDLPQEYRDIFKGQLKTMEETLARQYN